MNTASFLKRLQTPRKVLATLFAATAVWWWLLRSRLRRGGLTGALSVAAVALFFIAVAFAETVFRLIHLNRRQITFERQIQGLFGLYAELKPESGLPPLGEYALLPLTALQYVQLIRQLEPQTVVELGSGVSTLLAALQLRRNGSGRVIAIDHEEKWGQRTRFELRRHGVEAHAEVRHASLTAFTVEGRPASWYNPEVLQDIRKIDLLLIDGPPDRKDSGERQPGLSLLGDRFHQDTVILVDDIHRPNWRRWVHVWASRNGFQAEELLKDREGGMLLYQRDGRFARLREGV